MSKSSPTPSLTTHNVDPNYVFQHRGASWCPPSIIQLFEECAEDFEHRQRGPQQQLDHRHHSGHGEEEVDIQSVLDIIDSVLRTVEDIGEDQGHDDEDENVQENDDLPSPPMQ